jgi:ankyrin repeat protein
MNSDDSPEYAIPPIDYDTAACVLHKAILDRHPRANNLTAKAVCLTTMCERFPGFHPDVTVVDFSCTQAKATFINVACHRGDLQTARGLFFLGAELCNRNETQRTVLIILCAASLISKRLSEHQQLLQTLLTKPEVRSLIDAQDSRGNTALHYASSPGVVQTLLAAGASLKITNNSGTNVFIRAATACNAKKLSLLLETGTIAVNEKFPVKNETRRDSALDSVCRNIRRNSTVALVASASVLIEAGADVNPETNPNDRVDVPPLQIAAFYGSVALVGLLIDHGADTSGLELMDYACCNRLNADSNTLDDLKGIVQLLLAANVSINTRNSGGMTVLMGTSLIDVVRFLVSHGADENAISSGTSRSRGMSVLMYACSREKSLEVVAFLAERVADINAAVANDASLFNNKKHRGKTALHFACVAPDTAYERVVVLLAAGATPAVATLLVFAARKACFKVFKRLFVITDEAGGLPVEGLLHACAERRGSLLLEGRKIVEFLLKRPEIATRVDALDANGCTPLWRTTDTGIAAHLVSVGADVNAVYLGTGASVLMRNCSDLEMTIFLLSCDHIDVNMACSIRSPRYVDKLTALHNAVNSCGGDSVKLLIEAGANVNAATSLGNTPLHVAASKSATPSADHLIRAGASLTFLNNLGKAPVDCIADKSSTLFKLLTHEALIAKKGPYARPPTARPLFAHLPSFLVIQFMRLASGARHKTIVFRHYCVLQFERWS